MFSAVVERGGHSTYRIMLAPETRAERFEALWQQLASLGCTYESAPPRFLAIDVPPQTDVYAVYRILARVQEAGLWSFEEGHCGHPPSGDEGSTRVASGTFTSSDVPTEFVLER